MEVPLELQPETRPVVVLLSSLPISDNSRSFHAHDPVPFRTDSSHPVDEQYSL